MHVATLLRLFDVGWMCDLIPAIVKASRITAGCKDANSTIDFAENRCVLTADVLCRLHEYHLILTGCEKANDLGGTQKGSATE